MAVFKLAGEADDWWNGVKGSLRQGGSITWARFVAAFNRKYFSNAVRVKREQKFIELEQGNATVDE